MNQFHTPYKLPALLYEAGVRFCISLEPGYPMDGHVRTLPDEAMKAYSWGLDKNEALRSITLSAAEILGVDEFIGSLEPGKDATFFISETEPLLQTTNPIKAYIKGRVRFIQPTKKFTTQVSREVPKTWKTERLK